MKHFLMLLIAATFLCGCGRSDPPPSSEELQKQAANFIERHIPADVTYDPDWLGHHILADFADDGRLQTTRPDPKQLSRTLDEARQWASTGSEAHQAYFRDCAALLESIAQMKRTL